MRKNVVSKRTWSSSIPNLFEWGLTKLWEQLYIVREGQEHQGGSDSYVTIRVFYELNNRYPNIQEKRFQNKLYGLAQLN